MSHEVENMFYTGETPWHGLGVPLKSPPTVEEGIRCAGLDWKVRVDSLRLPNGKISEKARVVLRETDEQELGVVGTNWTPLQNIDAFDFFQPFIDEGLADLHTAGSLRNGERIWVLAKINADPSTIVKGDVVDKFILLSNGHDGKLAVRVGFTPIRVVCANTLAFSHRNADSQLIRVRHTANVKEAVEDLREIMDAVNASFEATAEQYRALAQKQCKEDDLKKYIKIVFKRGVAFSKEIEESQTFLENDEMKRLNNQIIPLFESGRGNDMKGVKGTWWAGYNAVSEYLTWERGKTSDVRLDNLWFKQGASLNRKALDTAIRLAA